MDIENSKLKKVNMGGTGTMYTLQGNDGKGVHI